MMFNVFPVNYTKSKVLRRSGILSKHETFINTSLVFIVARQLFNKSRTNIFHAFG